MKIPPKRADAPIPSRNEEFRPRKKRVAIYLNNGETAVSIWAPTDGIKGHERLIAAVDAAREAFTAAYFGRRLWPPLPENPVEPTAPEPVEPEEKT